MQRVTHAQVLVGQRVVGAIDSGLLVLLGIHREDTPEDATWICERIPRLRLFDDETGRMNLSLTAIDGEALVVSQFTLFGSTRKGTRPSYNEAANPPHAIPLYQLAVKLLGEAIGKPVATGEFGAAMRVELVNDGPVTLLLDSRNRV